MIVPGPSFRFLQRKFKECSLPRLSQCYQHLKAISTSNARGRVVRREQGQLGELQFDNTQKLELS